MRSAALPTAPYCDASLPAAPVCAIIHQPDRALSLGARSVISPAPRARRHDRPARFALLTPGRVSPVVSLAERRGGGTGGNNTLWAVGCVRRQAPGRDRGGKGGRLHGPQPNAPQSPAEGFRKTGGRNAYAHGTTAIAATEALAGQILRSDISDPTAGATHFQSPRSMREAPDPRRSQNEPLDVQRVEGVEHWTHRPADSTAPNFHRVRVRGIDDEDSERYRVDGQGPVS